MATKKKKSKKSIARLKPVLHTAPRGEKPARKKKPVPQTLVSHLTEIRDRLFQSIIVLSAASVGAFFFRKKIMAAVAAPAGQLVFTAPAEAFFANLKLSMAVGFALTLPYLVWQVAAFVAPALEKKQRPMLWGGTAACVALFYVGAGFAVFLLGPGMEFFLGFGDENLRAMIKVDEYYSFALTLIAGCGGIFEMPVMVWVLARLGLVKADTLRSRWREALIIILIVSAFITPADAFTMIALAIPLTFLYGLSIMVAHWANPMDP